MSEHTPKEMPTPRAILPFSDMELASEFANTTGISLVPTEEVVRTLPLGRVVVPKVVYDTGTTMMVSSIFSVCHKYLLVLK